MSKEERAVLADPANMRECVFYSQRADGEVANLSFLAKLRRWFPILRLACWSSLVAALPVTLSGCMMGERSSTLKEWDQSINLVPRTPLLGQMMSILSGLRYRSRDRP